MHWAMLIILCALTGGVFGAVWLIVQANWTRQMRGRGVALFFAIVNCAFTVIATVVQLAQWMKWTTFSFNDYWDGLILALWIACVYTLRDELRSEPIGLPLGRFMPYLFGPVYFQYHLMTYGSNSAAVGSAGQPLAL
jgi:hypothetical protein